MYIFTYIYNGYRAPSSPDSGLVVRVVHVLFVIEPPTCFLYTPPPCPQGSLDNRSIILVCFPGAPQLSQKALQEEAALEKQIDLTVGGAFLHPSKGCSTPSVLCTTCLTLHRPQAWFPVREICFLSRQQYNYTGVTRSLCTVYSGGPSLNA